MVRLGTSTFIPGTLFFAGEEPDSPGFHYVAGEQHMPARLWAPLFERPDLVREALAGHLPDTQALQLDTFAQCAAALLAERKRRGLIRRRFVSGAEELKLALSLLRSTLTLGIRSAGRREPVTATLEVVPYATELEVSALLYQQGHRQAAQVRVRPRADKPEAALLEVTLEPPAPGDSLLSITLRGPGGSRHERQFPLRFAPQNPYIVGSIIDNPLQFYGRKHELESLERDIESGSIMLTGEMRIGKTSLLHQLKERLGERCVFFSLQPYEDSLEAVPEALARLIAPEVAPAKSAFESLKQAVAHKLGALSRDWGGAKVCFTLLLDEAQMLAKSDGLRHLLRGLLQTKQPDGLRAVMAEKVFRAKSVQNDSCTNCQGKGYYQVQNGGGTETVRCPQCRGIGYKGRMGIFEMFMVDDEVRQMINSSMTTTQLRRRARELGMRTLREDGIRKVLAGLTAASEVVQATMSDAD